MSEGPEPKIRLLGKVDKAQDLEVHLRELSFPDDEIVVLELRDWVPSRQRYARGYWLSRDSLPAVATLLWAYHQNPDLSYPEDSP